MKAVRSLALAAVLVTVLVASQAPGAVEGTELDRQGSTSSVDDAVPFEDLDGYTGSTAPLRVDLADTSEPVVLADSYGTVIPLTGDHGDAIARIPALLTGTYELRRGEDIATFTITGTGEVPADPGAQGEISGRSPLLVLALLVGAVGGALLLRRRTRPVGLLVFTIAGAAAVYTWQQNPVQGATMAACAKVHDDPSRELLDCALVRGGELVDRGAFAKALEELEAANIGACHEIAHRLGVRAWLEAEDPIEEIVRPGFDLCNHAFYHGALYGAATYMDDDEFTRVALDACDVIYPDDGPGGGACAHGIGHSLMVRFGADVDRVDRVCSQMRTDYEIRRLECQGAALMEYAVIHAHADGAAAREPLPRTDPVELCEQADDAMQSYCYGGLAMALPYSPTSAQELVTMCAGIAEESRQVRCVEGVVPEFRSHLGRVEGGGAVCRTLGGEARDVCARQYAYFLYDQYADAEFVASICRDADVDATICESAMARSRDWARTGDT